MCSTMPIGIPSFARAAPARCAGRQTRDKIPRAISRTPACPCTPAVARNSSSERPSRSRSARAFSSGSAPAIGRRTEAAEPKTRRLLRREHHDFDRAPRLEPRALQRVQRLKTAEHADDTVVESRIRNRIGVRAGANRGQGRLTSLPAGASVPTASSRIVIPASRADWRTSSCPRRSASETARA